MKIKNKTKRMDPQNWSDTITKKIKKTENLFTEDELDAIINALDWKADYTESLAIDCENDCEEYDNWDDNYNLRVWEKVCKVCVITADMQNTYAKL